MKILHVTAVDFATSRLLRPQLDHLVEQGFDVRVATVLSHAQSWADLAAYQPVDVGLPRSLSPGRMAAGSLRLLRLARSWSPDVVHLHTPAASLPIRLLPRSLWPKGCRLVYTVHGYLHQWPATSRRDRFIQRIEAFESHRTDLSLFQSREDLQEALAHGYGSRLVYLGNGVQDDWFELPGPSRGTHDFDVLFVGRVVREKGILDLIRVLSRVTGVTLHIAGDALPSDRDGVSIEVDRLVAELGLQGRVRRYGMLERARVQALMSSVHCVCLPSYREGLPRSVIEALAAGRPVLGTTVRGTRELVVHGNNGLLSEAGDIEALRTNIIALRDLGSAEFQAMSVRSRLSVDPERRESAVFARLTQAYRSLFD